MVRGEEGNVVARAGEGLAAAEEDDEDDDS